MKGRVLGYNPEKQTGVISGDDGNRYYFERAEWESPNEPTANASVDFEVKDEKNAVAIYKITGNAMVLSSGVGGSASGQKNKVVAAVFAFFFGVLGIHKFYLGRPIQGIIMFLTTFIGAFLLGIPTLLVGLTALVEGIVYLVRSQESFDRIYNQ